MKAVLVVRVSVCLSDPETHYYTAHIPSSSTNASSSSTSPATIHSTEKQNSNTARLQRSKKSTRKSHARVLYGRKKILDNRLYQGGIMTCLGMLFQF